MVSSPGNPGGGEEELFSSTVWGAVDMVETATTVRDQHQPFFVSPTVRYWFAKAR